VAVGQRSGITYAPRTEEEVAAFFAGLDLVGPGVVPVLGWRPSADDVPDDPRAAHCYAAMGRKP
jgi:S-adenosyl methyltransferase